MTALSIDAALKLVDEVIEVGRNDSSPDAAAGTEMLCALRDEVNRLRRRVRDECVGEQWLEQDFPAPEGGNLTLSTEAVIGIVRHALDDVVPRIADRCDRLVVRYHVVGAVPDIDDGSVLIRTDSGPEGMSSAVHPRLQALADANNEVERLRAIIEGRTTPPTIEEARTHIDAGGVFRMVCGARSFTAESMIAVDVAIEDFPGGRWWALDAQKRPCAWPTVAKPEEAPDAR
jgi:hypothetical protein